MELLDVVDNFLTGEYVGSRTKSSIMIQGRVFESWWWSK